MVFKKHSGCSFTYNAFQSVCVTTGSMESA